MHTEYKQGKAYCYFAWEFVQKAFLAQVFRILNQSGTFPDDFLERLHTFGSLVLLLLKIKLSTYLMGLAIILVKFSFV